MRSDAEFEAVQRLVRAGLNDCAISRATGIPRRTILDWRRQGSRELRDSRGNERAQARKVGDCPICETGNLVEPSYAYLLGLYLGDGCLSLHRRGVYVLRIVLDDRYPKIIDECSVAMMTMRASGRTVPARVRKVGCTEVAIGWKHWPCLFPQHGAGRKHLRPIVLAWWQKEVVTRYPERLLRGLIQSDGCRDLNYVNGKSYPRYQFTNESDDIRMIFIDACERLGLHWTTPTYHAVSISRRPDVAKLDRFIGSKLRPIPVAYSDPHARAAQLSLGLSGGS